MDYGYSERRRKGKDKRRDRKKHPYRKGGGHRAMNFSEKSLDFSR